MPVSGPHAAVRSGNAIQCEAPLLPVKEILAATDFSEQATLGLRIAARLARQLHGHLHVLYAKSAQVFAPGPGFPVKDMEDAREQLHQYASAIPEVRVTRHEEIVSPEPPVAAICQAAATIGIDLVVVGSHGRGGLQKAALGSVAEAAMRQLSCPVLVIGPRCLVPQHQLKSILLVTALRSTCRPAARRAVAIARQTGATLTVMHVLPQPDGAAVLLGIDAWHNAAIEMRRLVPRDSLLPRQVHYEIHTGRAAEEIICVAEQKKAGLIVLGTGANSAFADHLSWTLSSSVIRESRSPILSVPHEP